MRKSDSDVMGHAPTEKKNVDDLFRINCVGSITELRVFFDASPAFRSAFFNCKSVLLIIGRCG